MIFRPVSVSGFRARAGPENPALESLQEPGASIIVKQNFFRKSILVS